MVEWTGNEALHEKQNAQFQLYQQLDHVFISGDEPLTPLEYSFQGDMDEQVTIDLAQWIFMES
jgi:hypothetical protein